MEFLGDPQETELRTVQFYLQFWAWSQQERKRTVINPIWRMMMSVRQSEEALKKIETKVKENNKNDVRRGLVLGKTIPILAIEKQMIASKVDRIMNDPELWRGHYGDKEALLMFFLDSNSNSKGCNQSLRTFASKKKIYRGEAREILRRALLFFSTLYGIHC